jgi:hypothetical protein
LLHIPSISEPLVERVNNSKNNNNSAHVDVKAKVVPVIMGATGTISKSLRQYLSNIPGKHEIKELQTTYLALHPYYGKC